MQQIKQNLNIENEYCDHMKWEISKFEIYFFIIKFSTKLAQSQKKKDIILNITLKSQKKIQTTKKFSKNLTFVKINQKLHMVIKLKELKEGIKLSGILMLKEHLF